MANSSLLLSDLKVGHSSSFLITMVFSHWILFSLMVSFTYWFGDKTQAYNHWILIGLKFFQTMILISWFDFWVVLSFVYVSSWCWSIVIEETTQLCSSLQDLNCGSRIFFWLCKNHTSKLRKTNDWKQVLCVIFLPRFSLLLVWNPRTFWPQSYTTTVIRVLYFIVFISTSFVLAKYKMMVLFFKKLISVSISFAAGRECNWKWGASSSTPKTFSKTLTFRTQVHMFGFVCLDWCLYKSKLIFPYFVLGLSLIHPFDSSFRISGQSPYQELVLKVLLANEWRSIHISIV